MTIRNKPRALAGHAGRILAGGIAAVLLAACGSEPAAQAAPAGADSAPAPVYFD